MLGELGRLSVLVEDYDDAIEFYTERLGFELLFDGHLDDETRLVHLELPTQEGVGVWLFEARSDEMRERVGNQTAGAPLWVFYTDDSRGVYEELQVRGVTVDGPTSRPTTRRSASRTCTATSSSPSS